MANSRRKGKAGELEAADLIRVAFPDVKRHLGQERNAQDNGRDLDGTQPWCVQVKRHARVPYQLRLEAMGQALGSISSQYPYPVVMWREDRGIWMVSVMLSDVIEALDDLGALTVAEGGSPAHPSLDMESHLMVELPAAAWAMWWNGRTS